MINRTLSLREAVGLNNFGDGVGGPGSLQELLVSSHPNGVSIDNRTLNIGGTTIQARHVQTVGDCHLVHLIGYTAHDKIQVVPIVEEVDLDLADPPVGTEFLDGEMMILVRGNNVLICRCGLPDTALYNYVAHIATTVGIGPDVSRFTLGKRINVDKLALIAKEGVRRLTMNAVAHSVSVEEIERETVTQRMTGKVLDEIRDLLGLEAAIPEEAENLKVLVSLSFDRRRGTEIDRQQLQKLAETVLEEDDEGFAIETMTGRKVRANDILLSKTVSMDRFGKSVRHQEAWGHLIEFDTELRAQVAEA